MKFHKMDPTGTQPTSMSDEVQELWLEITYLSQKCEVPWVLGGDLIQLTFPNEKLDSYKITKWEGFTSDWDAKSKLIQSSMDVSSPLP